MPKKPLPPTFEYVLRFDALLSAFRRARRAKRGKGGEPAFYRDLESNLLRLSQELRDHTYRPDPYRYFRLWNKKERVVSEASFRDRVVHHSLVAALEPTFEALFIRHSYACRKGKGMHAAMVAARRLAAAFPYFLKLDVRKYFDCVSHDVLLEMLACEVADDGLLWLCRVLLDGADVPNAAGAPRGLPIGNLTSQFWANVYLNALDHYIRDDLDCGSYLRYMDDLVLFAHRKERLWGWAAAIRTFCRDRLRLELKDEVTVLAPVNEGVPWLGFRVHPGLVRIDAAGRRRFVRKLEASWIRAGEGLLCEEVERDRAASLCGHLHLANGMALRQSVVFRLDGVDPMMQGSSLCSTGAAAPTG